MLLCPPIAIRAGDFLSTELAAGFDPAAVAAVLLPDDGFRKVAGRIERDLAHPVRADIEDAAALAIGEDHRKRALAVIREFLSKKKAGEPGDAVPRPESPECRAWCPRCLCQYQKTGGECPDCPGVNLEPLPAVAGGRKGMS
jgi:hypothetical protein